MREIIFKRTSHFDIKYCFICIYSDIRLSDDMNVMSSLTQELSGSALSSGFCTLKRKTMKPAAIRAKASE